MDLRRGSEAANATAIDERATRNDAGAMRAVPDRVVGPRPLGRGVPKDLQEAYKWFALAARSGDPVAARRLEQVRARMEPVEIDAAEQRLAAFVMEERAVPRQGMPILEGGEVTSGTHSPMLDQGIGMGYVPAELAQPGTELTIDVRGRHRKARTVKKPIYRREE